MYKNEKNPRVQRKLLGFEEAIRATYPRSDIQQCVIRNTLRYVSWKDKRELSRDLREVYGASTLEQASSSMQRFEEKWTSKYLHVIKSWKANWERLMTPDDFIGGIHWR